LEKEKEKEKKKEKRTDSLAPSLPLLGLFRSSPSNVDEDSSEEDDDREEDGSEDGASVEASFGEERSGRVDGVDDGWKNRKTKRRVADWKKLGSVFVFSLSLSLFSFFPPPSLCQRHQM